jgi:16S rRNA (uracil1498-N3)-methyltransferase
LEEYRNLPRCYAPPANWSAANVRLARDESHHLLHVLRAGVGDRLLVFDGCGREVAGRITVVLERGEAEVEIVAELEARADMLNVELVQAIPKQGRMEFVLQKATELGAAAVRPIVTERTIVRIKESRQAQKKAERWRGVLLAAAKQCGVARIPRLNPIESFESFLAVRNPSDSLLICSLEDNARPLKDVLNGFGHPHAQALQVLVGPEGDFTPAEYERALVAGAIPVTLGNLVLRSDTAPLYILSAIRYHFS